MPKRVVLCTWSLPGLGWAYALRFPGNDEFSIDFPEEKEEKMGQLYASTQVRSCSLGRAFMP